MRKTETALGQDPMMIVEDVDEAFEELGGYGKHQKKLTILQILAMAMGSYALYPMSYYEL